MRPGWVSSLLRGCRCPLWMYRGHSDCIPTSSYQLPFNDSIITQPHQGFIRIHPSGLSLARSLLVVRILLRGRLGRGAQLNTRELLTWEVIVLTCFHTPSRRNRTCDFAPHPAPHQSFDLLPTMIPMTVLTDSYQIVESIFSAF